uniref:CD44 antigen n=1 Tax=Chrysemys picta bellii TaxID=8478 RepID=A0A8C3HER8_CHRPI
MSKFLLCATFGLCLLQLCLAEIQFNISCRYAGVFHVEKNRRYSLTRDEAVELCKALNSTLPTMDQMKNAHRLGFETCRYGFIEDKIVIPRIKPYSLCAANNTGIYILVSNITDRYDTYCYNASETRGKACEPITRLDVSGHDNTSQIVIDNEDGSRYTDGVKHTDPTPVTDDNHVSSGSIHDGDATNPNIIGTRMPGTPYYEEITPDALSTDYSSGSGRKEDHPTSTNDIATPFDDKRGEDSTMISLITDGVPGKDHPSKGQHPTSTTVNPHHGAHEETSTQHEGNPSPDIWWGSTTDHKEQHRTTATKAVTSNDGAIYEDSIHDSLPPDNQPGWGSEDKYPTNTSRDYVIPGLIPENEDESYTGSTLNKHDGRRANPSGQVTTPKTASQPRSAQIPEWLIIVASLLALTLILAVCIAVNSRSRCGQKKKLVINNGKGSVSDKKMGGLNGEASKSQEMVHLVNKQQPDNRTGPCDEFLTTDETKNQQEANMKTGL